MERFRMVVKEQKNPWTPERVRALGLTTDLPVAGEIFGLSAYTSYVLARRGEFPVPLLRLGSRRIRVSTAAILRYLSADTTVEF